MSHSSGETNQHQPVVLENAQIMPWRERWAERVCTQEDLVRFVNDVGCCTTIPLPGYPDFPNQRDVMGVTDTDEPDTWFWKDDLHTDKRIYYTRVFGGKTGFISYALLPALMATNGAVADELIFNGLLSPDAQQIYHTIDAHGPIGTKNLKILLTADEKLRADRVLIDLDRKFLITKSGITGRTRGTYSYIWDLVERWVPELLADADHLGRKQAAAQLREHLATFGIPPESSFYTKVLGWSP